MMTVPSTIDLSLLVMISTFKLSYADNRVNCGGIVDIRTIPMATILSPNFPNPYPVDVNCIWEIIAAPNKAIKVYSFKFDVENDQNCLYDSLTIIESTSQYPLGVFCGQLGVGLLTQSSINSILMRFVSDSWITASGFYLLIVSVDGATATALTPTLTTPCQRGAKSCSVCGTPKVAPLLANKIVGGNEAVPHSWPWQIALYTSTGRQICGGSILNSQWIITAAHCCKAFPTVPSTFRVQIGAHNLKSTSEPYARILELDQVIVHPNYTSEPETNWDYCLLRTQQIIAFNDDVQPLCLPSLLDGVPGTKCYVTGWGSTVATKVAIGRYPGNSRNPAVKAIPNVLYQTDVVVKDLAICNASYGGIISPQMLCATTPGHDSCQGDSGGPLACQDASDTAKWKLVGVVSWGWGCAQPNAPGVYARITSALSWINSIIN